ncbi:MAG: hypothetical protein ACFE8A_14890 [Candidatus Hodarchaeota archaeon]
MMKPNSIDESIEKAVKSYDNIKKALKGLLDIVRISNPSENDIYFKLAQDNIIVLYQNVIDLIMNDNGIKQLKNKLRESEKSKNTQINKFFQSNK